MDRKTSVRNFVPNEASGVDGRTAIKGSGAQKTKSQSETNVTKQYTTDSGKGSFGGNLGGENSNS